MANEKVQNNSATEAADNSQVKTNTVAADKYQVLESDGMVIIPDLVVKRRPYEVKGEQYFEYFAEGTWGNKTLEIMLGANTVRGTEKRFKDRDTYELLDTLFDMYDVLRFGVKVVKGNDGRSTVSYHVVGISPANVWSPVGVNIERPSSRSKLAILINEAAAKYGITLPSIL